MANSSEQATLQLFEVGEDQPAATIQELVAAEQPIALEESATPQQLDLTEACRRPSLRSLLSADTWLRIWSFRPTGTFRRDRTCTAPDLFL